MTLKEYGNTLVGRVSTVSGSILIEIPQRNATRTERQRYQQRMNKPLDLSDCEGFEEGWESGLPIRSGSDRSNIAAANKSPRRFR